MKTALLVITRNPPIQRLLLFSLLVQLVFCITQVGFLHPDQHFQLIEFSSYQLGRPSGATSVWELTSQIRPTLQVYLLSGFIELCQFVSISSPYTQLLLLRLVVGLMAFVVFNWLGIHYFQTNRKLLFPVLLLLNFSWTLPYIRTLFSSEMASSVVFFGALLLYETKKDNWLSVLVVGFLFSLAFYLRFQMAFGLVGFGIWLLLFDKRYDRLLPMALGFIAGIGLNILLDYYFYHAFVFTPYRYYQVNITEGKAAEFGTSSPLFYILMLTLVIGTPPLSFFLFYYSLKGILQQYRQSIVLVVVFFVIGHSLVGHKEERFMFPILNALPIIAGWGLSSFMDYYRQAKPGIRAFLNGILYTSGFLTVLTLVFFSVNPYSQSIEFSRKLVNEFSSTKPIIYCVNRTPFETENHLPLTFYRNSAQNLNMVIIQPDSVRKIKGEWLATTYNDSKGKLALYDSLGYKPQLYSSTAFWKINEFLQSKNINTINEIWVLYKKE